jgi:hypothetical protein
MFFKRIRRTPTQRLQFGEMCFCGEQKGAIEDEFKARLLGAKLFTSEVKEAYLMRVLYSGESSENVALCLISDTGKDKELVRKIGDIFQAIFSADANLDTIFLEHQYWKQVRSIASPFFKRNEND